MTEFRLKILSFEKFVQVLGLRMREKFANKKTTSLTSSLCDEGLLLGFLTGDKKVRGLSQKLSYIIKWSANTIKEAHEVSKISFCLEHILYRKSIGNIWKNQENIRFLFYDQYFGSKSLKSVLINYTWLFRDFSTIIW